MEDDSEACEREGLTGLSAQGEPMTKCIGCMIVKVLAGLGALNWGLVTYFDLNLVTQILGDGTMLGKIVYTLIGLAGLITLISVVKNLCPCAGKSCSK